MRVVLDTNVLVSAFLFENRLGGIVRLIEQGQIVPCFFEGIPIIAPQDFLKKFRS